MAVKTEKDLADAVKNGQDTIEIEGDLGRKVVRIKATGKVAWAVAVGAIGVAALGAIYPVPEPTTQVTSKVFAVTAAGSAIAILGFGTTVAAISISVAAGGVAVLNRLRTYKIVSKSSDRVVLRKS